VVGRRAGYGCKNVHGNKRRRQYLRHPKGGSGYFTPQQVIEISKLVQEKAAAIRKKLGW